jgi:nitrogen regulatory protein PII
MKLLTAIVNSHQVAPLSEAFERLGLGHFGAERVVFSQVHCLDRGPRPRMITRGILSERQLTGKVRVELAVKDEDVPWVAELIAQTHPTGQADVLVAQLEVVRAGSGQVVPLAASAA